MREKIAAILLDEFGGLPPGAISFDEVVNKILTLFTPSCGELISDEEIRIYYLGSRLSAVKDALQAQARHTAQQKNRGIAELFEEFENLSAVSDQPTPAPQREIWESDYQSFKAKYLSNKP